MVSFSNMDGAHCDSVVDHYTLPSNSIQMDVKVPVQPSNFDPLQKGALMGASTFMEQDKNHSNQCNYKTKSIPSPGTTIQRTQPMAGFLLLGKRQCVYLSLLWQSIVLRPDFLRLYAQLLSDQPFPLASALLAHFPV